MFRMVGRSLFRTSLFKISGDARNNTLYLKFIELAISFVVNLVRQLFGPHVKNIKVFIQKKQDIARITKS